MKYIDADKLKAEIERLYKEYMAKFKTQVDSYHLGICDGLDVAERVLDTLQEPKNAEDYHKAFDELYGKHIPNLQEPEVDLVAELKHHLATTPKEQLEKEWKELEPWGNIGPTVQEFLYGKQSGVDLDADIQMEWDSFNYHLAEYGYEQEEVVWLNRNSFEDVARYFYELGKNSK